MRNLKWILLAAVIIACADCAGRTSESESPWGDSYSPGEETEG